MSQIRLDRYLSNNGYGSRSQVKKALNDGQIKVNGIVVRSGQHKIDPFSDRIVFDGVLLEEAPVLMLRHYIMLNKPAGCVSATTDRHERTVLDCLPPALGKGLAPVGRLDKDTEGLLLLTDDGMLSHNLLSPRHHVEKRYLARIDCLLSPEDCRRFAGGLDIGDGRPTLPARLEPVPGEEMEWLVTIKEGRYHQVKRMFGALGAAVLYLKRLSMGPLELDPELAPGEYRPLTQPELAKLKMIQ